MRRETEKLLKEEEEFPEQIEQERAIHELPRQDQECRKKHGIVCRILTTLRLKKKGSDRQKLLSESQEHLPQPDNHLKDVKEKKKSKKKAKGVKSDDAYKTKPRSNSVPTRIPRRTSSLLANSNNNNNAFTTTYEMLDNESHHSCEYILEPGPEPESIPLDEHEKVIITIEEVTEGDQHVYGDDNFGESYFSRPDGNPLVERSKSNNASEYLRHKWHGKRAKKTRKRIRRVMRATYQSLQSVTTQASNAFPSPHQVMSVVSSPTPR